ncbi:hypothetical protein [Bradyrhizobium neotropicale]|uniref:hypothetical protein n=1 Tax=Bradyrhizobium neotropicale TaxID=1497615 RepID=UPI001AD6CE87|nr:hypothetical protein [Bradyrhizobium neotropicale]MBO4228043.1 hypothetical protein [Bradyrhizobium neotropicale]
MDGTGNQTLLQEVENFLQAHNLSATRFGVLAAGDTKFVGTLRKGRKLRSLTEQRIREWMRAQQDAEATAREPGV